MAPVAAVCARFGSHHNLPFSSFPLNLTPHLKQFFSTISRKLYEHTKKHVSSSCRPWWRHHWHRANCNLYGPPLFSGKPKGIRSRFSGIGRGSIIKEFLFGHAVFVFSPFREVRAHGPPPKGQPPVDHPSGSADQLAGKHQGRHSGLLRGDCRCPGQMMESRIIQDNVFCT